MKNTKIIYIAGYMSTKNSRLTIKIKEEFKENELLLIHDYDFHRPKDVISYIDSRINEFVDPNDVDVIIIGQSYGGYFANYFSEKYGFSAFLINPLIDPSKSQLLRKRGAIFKGVPRSTDNREVFKQLFLSTEDDVVKNVWSLEAFPNREKLMLVNEGHRIENLDPIVSTIKNYVYNLQESL